MEARSKIRLRMLLLHSVAGLCGQVVAAVEQGGSCSLWTKGRNEARRTPHWAHWTPSIEKARISHSTLLNISPPLRPKICSGVWLNISQTCLHCTGTWCWFLKFCNQNPSTSSTLRYFQLSTKNLNNKTLVSVETNGKTSQK